MLRTSMAREQVSADVGRIIRQVYPEQPYKGIATLDEIVGASVSDRRAYAFIATTFGIAMLLLCALGLSGHLSHVVTERSRDLAIRSALGASLGLRLALLIRHVTLALTSGVVIAVAAVSLAYPVVKRFLFEIGRFDFVSVFISVIVVTTLTAVALAFPARRLTKTDIATELRST